MKQKTRIKNFGNIGYRYLLLVHEWPIYRHPYQPQKSRIGQSLITQQSFQMYGKTQHILTKSQFNTFKPKSVITN